MAKGNLILGTLGGSIGDLTMYRARGQQISRARIRKIGNPRSEKQQLQRAILATNSQFYSRFSEVLNNALQSQGTPWATQAALAKYNLSLLRNLAALGSAQLVPKGLNVIAPNDYVVSRGTLPSVRVASDIVARNVMEDDGFIPFNYEDIAIDDSFQDNLLKTPSKLFPNVRVGDQITILYFITQVDGDTPSTIAQYCRFAFKTDNLPALVLVSPSLNPSRTNPYRLNPAAIDLSKAAGPWQSLRLYWDEFGPNSTPFCILWFKTTEDIDLISGAAVIVSREEGRLRSNADIVSSSRVDSVFNMENAVPTYGAGGTPIDMPSEVYLNNDAQQAALVPMVGQLAGRDWELPWQIVVPSGSSASQVFGIKSNLPEINLTSCDIEIHGRFQGESVNVTLTESEPTAAIAQDLTIRSERHTSDQMLLSLVASSTTSSDRAFNVDSILVIEPNGNVYQVV